MRELFDFPVLPPLLVQFIVTVLFSFIIGLELHSYRRANEQDLGFGTTRTFTLIGVVGFVLYTLDERQFVYIAGLIGLVALLSIYYYQRASEGLYSLIGPLLGLLTYLIAPVVIQLPNWFAILYVVTTLLLFGEMPRIRRFSDAFRSTEIVTFSKFLLMAGVVLPLLPDTQVAPFVTVSYYQVWAALLVVSGLSYASYLVQTYLLKEKGMLLTGLLGGLYSSTATTLVLSRQAKGHAPTPQLTQAIILATVMMYLRLLLLAFFLGHANEALSLLGPFLVFIIASLIVVLIVPRFSSDAKVELGSVALSNPLEFRTALVFAVLFVAFTAATSIVIDHYGSGGLRVLSVVIGLTDIDPFILSLFGGTFKITDAQLIGAVVIASGSNNLVKAAYAAALGRNRYALAAAGWLVVLFIASIVYALVFIS